MLALAACAGAPEAIAPITSDSLRALRWIAPEADAVKALTVMPQECEAPLGATAADGLSSLADKRRLGKLAFESPALLGGAAARMGLSCSSCHLNGRGNVDFFVEGLSGAPGTADVTSSLFSKKRGDGAFNPVPIPDLGLRDGAQMKVRTGADFRAKVRGLVVEEFDGQEPPAYVFEALLAYIDGLGPEHCLAPDNWIQPGYIDDMASAMYAVAVAANAEASPELGLFYVRVARERFERLHERFARTSPEVAAALIEASGILAERADRIRGGDSAAQMNLAPFLDLMPLLREHAERSLYNPDVLRAALQSPK